MIYVYNHAADRYIERIDPTMTRDEAKAKIYSHRVAIMKAAEFGADRVRIDKGAILQLAGFNVVTVKRRGVSGHMTRRQRRELDRMQYA